MKPLALALMLLALPVAAQQVPAPGTGGVEEGADLIQRGMESILEGLVTGMRPALDDMGRALAEMRPMAEELLRLVDNIGNYEAPVVLENGDILIRRKPAEPAPLGPPKAGETEL